MLLCTAAAKKNFQNLYRETGKDFWWLYFQEGSDNGQALFSIWRLDNVKIRKGTFEIIFTLSHQHIITLFLQHFRHCLSDISRAVHYMNATGSHDLHLCSSSIIFATNDSTGMTHTPSRRSCLPGNKSYNRFFYSRLILYN